MKSRLLREFIRESLMEADDETTSQTSIDSKPAAKNVLSWKEIVKDQLSNTKEYTDSIERCLSENTSDINDAADYYNNLGPKIVTMSYSAAPLMRVMLAAIQTDLNSGQSGRIFPLALVTVLTKIDGSWDNLLQMVQKIGSIVGLGTPLAILAAIVLSVPGTVASWFWDYMMPSMQGTARPEAGIDTLWSDVGDSAITTIKHFSDYFVSASEENYKAIGTKLASLATAIKQKIETEGLLEELFDLLDVG
jgi:hypothetical protein